MHSSVRRCCAALLQERPSTHNIMKAVAAVLAILLFAAAATAQDDGAGHLVEDQLEGEPGFGSAPRANRCVPSVAFRLLIPAAPPHPQNGLFAVMLRSGSVFS